jgi:hypothetical protein
VVHSRVIKWFLACVVGFAGLMLPLLPDQAGYRSRVRAAGCWTAAITRQWTNLDLIGSVLRVSVDGEVGLPVSVRSLGDFQTIGFTGTKPEYGPYVAEFAPLSRGHYVIEPAGLGHSFMVWLDGRGYTYVDFTLFPCVPTPTVAPPAPLPISVVQPTAVPAPTVPPPPPAPPPYTPTSWQGRVLQHLKKLPGSYFASIVVRVTGRPAGQEVTISSGDWNAVCKTGTKPEHGPDACEFGALNGGTYRLTPAGLDTHLDVEVDLGDFVLIEFYETSGGGGQTVWVGSVVDQTSGSEPTGHSNSAIAVVVAGKPWHKVEIRAEGWVTTAETGYKPEYGPDACEFGGLRAGTYTITPEGLGASMEVTMDGWGWALVRFDPVVIAAPQVIVHPSQPTGPAVPQPVPSSPGAGWQGWIVSNSSGTRAGTGTWSVIVVRVVNRAGVPVKVSSEGGWSATCTTGAKPEYGPDACEIGALWPATYFVRPEGADTEVEVTMDGLGIAFIDFAAP